MTASLHYLYAITRAPGPAGELPEGIDGAAVVVEAQGEVAALTSRLDAAAYDPGLDERVADLEWLGPRARAHDAVVSWASERGPVVPLPMFTLFREAEGVGALLRARAAELSAALARVDGADEYGVRLFRIDAVLAERVAALSERVAELERQAAAAPPGQRYLLQRKLDAERASEARRVGREVARETLETLRRLALDAATDPVPARREGAVGAAILSAAFLVRRDALDDFRRALTALVERYEPSGFRFDFTGPWPPYHFVAGAAGDAGVRGARDGGVPA